MTIEIKQLILRGVVDGRGERFARPGRTHAATSHPPGRPAPAPTPGADQAAIVAACVREVLRRLERARER